MKRPNPVGVPVEIGRAEADTTTQAEQMLLGGLLLDGAGYDRIADTLADAAAFSSREHRLIFSAITALHERATAHDYTTVTNLLNERGDLATAGGAVYVGSLVNNCPGSANLEAYAAIVGAAASRRRTLDGLELARGAVEAGDDALAQVEIQKLADAQGAGRVGFHLDAKPITEAELTTAPKPKPHVIKPLGPGMEVIELSGAHGLGKSTLALDMALHVACGFSYAGLQTQQGRAYFVSREDARDDVLRRAYAWLEGMDSDQRAACAAAILKNLTIFGRAETVGLRLVGVNRGEYFIRHDAVAALARKCRGAALVVLETASRLGVDESNEGLAVLADACEVLAQKTGAAVVVVRHVSKAAAREGTTDSFAGRGGASFSDAARSVLILTQLSPDQIVEAGIEGADGDAVLQLTHAKASHSQKAAPIFFARRSGHSGPVLEQLRGMPTEQGEEGRLLDYIRARHTEGEQLPYRQFVADISLHHVPARRIKPTLARLLDSQLIETQRVRRGNSFSTVYMPKPGPAVTGVTA